METKNIFHIDRTSGKRKAKDLFLRSAMAFALVHQPTQITASPDNQHHSDPGVRRQVSERMLVAEDNSPGKTVRKAPGTPPSPIIVFENGPGLLSGFTPSPDLSETSDNNRIRKQLDNINAGTSFDQVFYDVESHPEIFSQKDIADIKMYYPIYKAVADKFHIDWYLVWINHKEETGISDSKIAFNGESYPYFGGWQRNIITWPEAYVAQAFKGLEYLKSIKTKNKTDAREAAAMAAQVAPNIEQYINLGPYEAVLNAERIFTGDKAGTGLALTRADIWQECSMVFGSVLIPQS